MVYDGSPNFTNSECVDDEYQKICEKGNNIDTKRKSYIENINKKNSTIQKYYYKIISDRIIELMKIYDLDDKKCKIDDDIYVNLKLVDCKRVEKETITRLEEKYPGFKILMFDNPVSTGYDYSLLIKIKNKKNTKCGCVIL